MFGLFRKKSEKPNLYAIYVFIRQAGERLLRLENNQSEKAVALCSEIEMSMQARIDKLEARIAAMEIKNAM